MIQCNKLSYRYSSSVNNKNMQFKININIYSKLILIYIHWLLLADFSFFGQESSTNKNLNPAGFSSGNVYYYYYYFPCRLQYFIQIVNNMPLTFTISDIQCFTVQPVLEEQPRFKNKAVPDQIIK